MIETLEQAIAELCRLPDADQERIGRRLLSHLEKLNALDNGIDLLSAGEGRPLDVDEFLRLKSSGNGGRQAADSLVGGSSRRYRSDLGLLRRYRGPQSSRQGPARDCEGGCRNWRLSARGVVT